MICSLNLFFSSSHFFLSIDDFVIITCSDSNNGACDTIAGNRVESFTGATSGTTSGATTAADAAATTGTGAAVATEADVFVRFILILFTGFFSAKPAVALIYINI